MRITWLGQAGLLMALNGLQIMIDPYFSDSVAKSEPKNTRRVPMDGQFWSCSPDIMVFTHDHADHYDPETAPVFLHRTEKRMTVLSPLSVWQKARLEGGGHNYVLFSPETEWTEGGVRLTAVRAAHSDPYAIGVIIHDLAADRRYYVTGDTLYNTAVLRQLTGRIDAVFLPVNGAGNNMNMADAARFAIECGARWAVPVHFGMFDALDPREMACPNKVIPTVYREIVLPGE